MDWRYNTVWFDQISDEIQYHLNWKEDKVDQAQLLKAIYSVIWHMKVEDKIFKDLPVFSNLKLLELNWSNCKDLIWINKFPNLRRLELHYCVKLASLEGIQLLADSLQFLHLNQSKKISNIDCLLGLKKLRVLCLNSIGSIDNLKFLEELPELIDFRFVDTNILDGDLTPIIEHPNIKSVGFLNKRHYNYKSEQLNNILKEKGDKQFKDFAWKGEFKTYKYKSYETE